MKIYFSGSVRGGSDDKELYQEIIREIQKYGEVISFHLRPREETKIMSDQESYERDREELKSTDILIAEVTTPSLGVGYEIASAEHLKIPILCLYRSGSDRKLSNMIAGSPHVTVREYQTIEDVPRILEEFISIHKF